MSNSFVVCSRGIAGCLAFVGLGLGLRSQTSNDTSDEPVYLNQIVVTGSYLPDLPTQATTPVEVFGQEDFVATGVDTNLADVLRKASPLFTGNGNLGLENANSEAFVTQGGSFLQIHNLHTLVLIDGRKVAFDPAEAALGVEFVDLNMIPVSAIDHVEILTDGSSALYGSDAVGGVINVILKSDFNGWKAGVHWAASDNAGHYSERSGYLSGGVSTKRSSIMISVESSQSDPIFMNQRPYSNPIYTTTTYPGVISVQPYSISVNPSTGQESVAPGALSYYRLNPSLNAPPMGLQYSIDQLVQMGDYEPVTAEQLLDGYNVANQQTLLSSFRRRSIVADFETHLIGDSLVFFGDATYGYVLTQSQVAGQSLSPYISAPFTDPFVYGSTPPPSGNLAFVPYVPYTQPNSPFSPTWLFQQNSPLSYTVNVVNANNLFANYPLITRDESELYRFAGGFKGAISPDYSWEIGTDLNRYHLGYSAPGQIDTEALNAALAAGTINAFAYSQAPGSLPDGVIGTKTDEMVSSLYSVDALIKGSPFDVPAGKVSFALGASYTRETLTANPDATSEPIASGLSIAGWLNTESLSPFSASRSYSSLYGELKIPVVSAAQKVPGIHELTADVAGRYDNYSQVGHSTVPEGSLNYEPLDERFSLRASVGRSFGAPELAQLFGPEISGPIPPFTYQGYYGNTASSAGFTGLSGPNPDLRPFTANTWSTGFVLAPRVTKGFALSFDFFAATVQGAIGYLNQVDIVQSVELQGPNSPFAQYVHVGSPTGPGVTAPGQLSTANPTSIYVQVPLINLASQADKGFDAKFDYVFTTESAGHFKIGSTATVWNSYLVREIPTQNYYQYAGTASGGGSSSQGTIPRWRTYSTVDWTKGAYEAEVGHTYIPSVDDIGPGGYSATAPVHVGDYEQFDASIGYVPAKASVRNWLGKFDLRFGVNNLFNRMPPVAPNAFPSTNADVGDYNGPIGRMYYVDVGYAY